MSEKRDSKKKCLNTIIKYDAILVEEWDLVLWFLNKHCFLVERPKNEDSSESSNC